MKIRTVVALCAAAAALSFGALSVLQKAEHRKAVRLPEASLQASTDPSTSASLDKGMAVAAIQNELRPAGPVEDSNRPLSRSHVSLAQLPAENVLLHRGMIDSRRAGVALKRENFAGTVAAFEGDSRTDSLATQLTNAYRTSIEATLAEFKGGGLDRFSCGLSLCVGSIRSTGGAELPEEWWQQLNAGKNLSIYAFSQASTELGQGNGETRFIFSTSQANNGFYVAPPP